MTTVYTGYVSTQYRTASTDFNTYAEARAWVDELLLQDENNPESFGSVTSDNGLLSDHPDYEKITHFPSEETA